MNSHSPPHQQTDQFPVVHDNERGLKSEARNTILWLGLGCEPDLKELKCGWLRGPVRCVSRVCFAPNA